MKSIPEENEVFTEASQCIRTLYSKCDKPFKECDNLANCVCILLHDGEIRCVSKLIKRLSVIYRNTESGQVKTALENVFLYKVGDAIFLSKRRRELMALLPDSFHEILMKQVITFGP